MSDMHTLRLNPAVEILHLDTCLKQPMYQLRIGEWLYRINENTLAVLRRFETPRDEDELDRMLQSEAIAHFDVAGLKDLLISKQILIGNQPAAKITQPSAKTHPLALRISLFSQKQLRPLTLRLGKLFYFWTAVFLVAFIGLTHFAFFYAARAESHSLLQLTHADWVLAIISCYFLLFMHELGHSSACTHYGARHDDIGIGIYLIYPVLYANVTDCWRLPRLERAVVDAAGLYFQLIGSGIYSMAWLLSHHPAFLVGVYSSLAAVLINLNPFLRFDGYWLLTDITALPSLRRSNRELWVYCWTRLLGKKPSRVPEFFSASRWIETVFVAYSVCSLSFFVYFFGQLSAVLVPYLYHQYPVALAMAWHKGSLRQFDMAFLGILFKLMGLSAMLFGVVVIIRGLLQKVAHLLRLQIARFRRKAGSAEPRSHIRLAGLHEDTRN